jgi:2-dehydro-3-deoxyphosphogluconate aldolase/(4S)-4-hydroxy-2-oxoglutarate aldolase
MSKYEVLQKITKSGVVAVIRAESKEQGEKIISAAKNGGIKAIEITMTVPGAVDIIKELAHRYHDEDIIIGAGTVLDPETARICILSGAQYIVSPSLNIETVKLCNRYGIAVIPGVMTVKEAIEALEYGVEILKIFPGNAFDPSIIGAFKGPIPQAEFMPTGGVSIASSSDWIKAGAVAIGTGSELTRGAKTGNFELIEQAARDFVLAVEKARQ